MLKAALNTFIPMKIETAQVKATIVIMRQILHFNICISDLLLLVGGNNTAN